MRKNYKQHRDEYKDENNVKGIILFTIVDCHFMG